MNTETTLQWYYTSEGKVHGPVPEAQIAAHVKAGVITRYDKLYNDVLKQWVATGKFYDEEIATYQEKRPNFLLKIILCGVFMALGFKLAIAGIQPPEPEVIIFWMITVGSMSTIIGLIFGLLILRDAYIWGKIFKQRDNRILGLTLQGISLVLGWGALVIFLVLTYFANMNNHLDAYKKFAPHLKSDAYNAGEYAPEKKFVIVALPQDAPNRIAIQGPASEGFATKLAETLEKNPDVEYIRIQSSGGNLLEMVRAAKVIEQYPHIPVNSLGQCDDSCLVFFMAAEKRWASAGMNYTLYGPRNFKYFGALQANGTTPIELGREADAYLRKRGFPETSLQAFGFSAKQTDGPIKQTTFSADDLISYGAVTGIITDGQLLNFEPTPEQIVPSEKLEYLKTAPDGMSKAEKDAINNLINVLSKEIDVFEKLYPTLLETRDNLDDITLNMRSIMNPKRPDFANYAEAEDVYMYFLQLAKQTEEIYQNGNNKVCYFFPDNRSTIARKYLNTDYLPEFYNTYAKMVTNGDPKNTLTPEANQELTQYYTVILIGADAVYRRDFATATGTREEKEEAGGCQRMLHIFKEVKNAPAHLRAGLAKIFILTSFQ